MDKERCAIERLQWAAQLSAVRLDAPLILMVSGGKDSDVCLSLARAAGIRYEVMHNHTTADAPETVYHVREQFRRLELAGIRCTINWPVFRGQRVSMWSLIAAKRFPPTRVRRYCCEILKEGGGSGRVIATGCRWAESRSRAENAGVYEKSGRGDGRIILMSDNDDKRRLFEHCNIRSRFVCNPIIDWSDDDIKQYTSAEHVRLNPLYSRGFKRVGCIGCPLTSQRVRRMEFAMYPAFEGLYLRAFERMLAARSAERTRLSSCAWESPEDVMRWWMQDGVLVGQQAFPGF